MSERLADHFNGISHEFDGLDPASVAVTYSTAVPVLAPHQVAIRLKKFRKPKSMVRHDIFPSLVNDAST